MVELAILRWNTTAWPATRPVASFHESAYRIGGFVAGGFCIRYLIGIDNGSAFAQPLDGLRAHPPEAVAISACSFNTFRSDAHQLSRSFCTCIVDGQCLQLNIRARSPHSICARYHAAFGIVNILVWSFHS